MSLDFNFSTTRYLPWHRFVKYLCQLTRLYQNPWCLISNLLFVSLNHLISICKTFLPYFRGIKKPHFTSSVSIFPRNSLGDCLYYIIKEQFDDGCFGSYLPEWLNELTDCIFALIRTAVGKGFLSFWKERRLLELGKKHNDEPLSYGLRIQILLAGYPNKHTVWCFFHLCGSKLNAPGSIDKGFKIWSCPMVWSVGPNNKNSESLYYSAKNSRALCFSNRQHSIACRFSFTSSPSQQKNPYNNNVKALSPFSCNIQTRDVLEPFEFFLNSSERAPRRPKLYFRHGYVSSYAFCENLVTAQANTVPCPPPWQIPCPKP